MRRKPVLSRLCSKQADANAYRRSAHRQWMHRASRDQHAQGWRGGQACIKAPVAHHIAIAR
jgi:hypothetical protein